MFVLFLIPLTYSITTSDCESVTCGTGITSGDCISVSGSTVTVYGCKAGYYCDYSVLGEVGAWQNVSCKYLFNSVNKCSNLQSDLTTGYVCCKDSECAQEKCSSNVCVGKSSGNSCSKSNQCAKGLYCDNKICKSLKKFGDTCDEDDECAIGAACSLKKCVKMFSLDPGQDADNGKVCTSNFASEGVCQNIEIYQDDKKLEYPYECNIGSDCIYKLSESELTYKGSCVCGGSNSTTGFCSEFARYTKDVNIMLSEMQYSDSKCSGSEAHTLNHHILYMCGSISFDMYYKYSRFMGQLLYHSLFNDESLKGCSMSLGIFDPYYEFSPKKDFSQYLKLSFLVITLLS